jgi:rhodanese-related sulfurtransferase
MYKKAASLVAKKGYQNIKVFRNGIPGWIKSGYALAKENALPKTKVPTVNAGKLKGVLEEVVILDIRTPSLYKMGWIKDSHKIPLAELSSRYDELTKDESIVVVDHAGKQVLTASRFLKSKGFGKVQRLQGGMMACVSGGIPLQK